MISVSPVSLLRSSSSLPAAQAAVDKFVQRQCAVHNVGLRQAGASWILRRSSVALAIKATVIRSATACRSSWPLGAVLDTVS